MRRERNWLDIIELIFCAILRNAYCVDLVNRFGVRRNFCANAEFRNSNVREQDVKARNVGRV